MTKALEGFANNCANPGPRSIYRAGPALPVSPSCFYLYHIVKRPGERTSVRAYFYDRGEEIESAHELQQLLIGNAAGDRHSLLENIYFGRDWPVEVGKGFDAVNWRRKSHIIVVLDHPTRRLKECGAVTFFPGDNDHKDNFCFCDAVDWDDFQVVDSSGETLTLSAVSFINHMNADDLDGDIKPGHRHAYRFRIKSQKRDGLRDDDYTYDSGGTNLGPPVPPPVRRRAK